MTMRWVAVAVLAMGLGVAKGQMEAHEHKPSVPSTSLTVSVDGKPVSFTLAELQAMPQRTLKVFNAHTKMDESYSGVGVSDLLAKYGVTTEGGGAKRVYRSYVKAEGTDHYWVIYSASELEPSLHATDAIVALSADGKPLGEDGAFKLVTGSEKKPARWVRNLTALTLVTVE
jgi:hypothetical protein